MSWSVRGHRAEPFETRGQRCAKAFGLLVGISIRHGSSKDQILYQLAQATIQSAVITTANSSHIPVDDWEAGLGVQGGG